MTKRPMTDVQQPIVPAKTGRSFPSNTDQIDWVAFRAKYKDRPLRVGIPLTLRMPRPKKTTKNGKS